MFARSHLHPAKTWRLWIVFPALLCLIVAETRLRAAVHDVEAERPRNERELIVKFRKDASAQERSRVLRNASSVKALPIAPRRPGMRAAAIQPPSQSSVARIQVAEGLELDAEFARLQNHPAVEYVEPNHSIKLFVQTNSAVFPDDFEFSKMYGLHNLGGGTAKTNADISAPEAWSFSTGSKSVIVAVIDTGIDYLHEDLKENLWINTKEVPFNGVDDDANGFVDDVYGYDFVSSDSDPFDDNQHGTHVAGTIGAKGNNGIGTVGVCWEVSLMALKAFDEHGNGTVAEAIAAITYAVENGARIINASWGLDERSRALEEATQFAAEAGVLFVAAAGNSRSEAPSYPASFETVLSVAATDARDARADFSNYGAFVDVAAPGANIISTLPENGYGPLSGTSMAAPHVVGAAALVLARFPMYSRQELFDILVNSVDTVLFDQPVGNGRLNLSRAVQMDQPLPTARLFAPATASGIVDLTGVATGTFFAGYSVNIGAGRTPTNWIQVTSSPVAVTNAPVGRFDSALVPDGHAVVQLVVSNRNGASAAVSAPVRVFNGLITYPLSGDILAPGKYQVRGTVHGPGKRFELSYGAGFAPATWIPIASGEGGQIEALLGEWDASNLPAGHYVLRLIISKEGGSTEFLAPLIYIDHKLKPGWPVYLPTDGDFPATEWRNFRPADLDGDGRSEFVLVNAGTRLRKQEIRVYDLEGKALWKRELGFDIPPDFAVIGDVDGDGKKEIFVDGTNGIVGFRWDGRLLQGWPVQAETSNHAKVLADLDADGTLELIAYGQEYAATQVAETRELAIYRHDGTLLRKWTLPWCGFTNDVQKIFPAVANLDDDPALEIVVPSGCSELLAFDHERAEPKWRASVTGKLLSSPVIGDVDGNGFVDIVATTCAINPGELAGIYILDRAGQRWSGWPVLEEFSFITAPALGDLDRDGRLEIVLIEHDINASLHVVQWDGFEADGWPLKIYTDTSSRTGISIADIDNNGFPEIVQAVAGYPGLTLAQRDPKYLGGIIARDFAGKVIPLNGTDLITSLPFESSGQTRFHKAAPVGLTDLDGNGRLDLVFASVQDRTFGSFGKLKERSSLYTWELETPMAAVDWPMFGHDVSNSGRYSLPLSPTPTPTNVTRAIRDRLITSEDRELRIHVTTNDWNATAAPLEVIEVSSPTNGAVTIEANSILVYRPKTNYFGMDAFTYKIRDVEGTTSTASVLLRVKPLNDPPVAEAIDLTMTKNSSVDVYYAGHDSETEKLSYRIVNPPEHGELWNYPTVGTYYPKRGFSGIESFSYVANDGRLDSVPAWVTITVINSNNPPKAIAQSVLTKTNRSVLITPGGSDPDNDPLTFEMVRAPEIGTAVREGTGFRFVPPLDYVGEGSFTFRAHDGTAFSEEAVITIGVIATNASPRARNGSATVQPNAESPVRISGSDPDGDKFHYTIVTLPLHGNLSGTPPDLIYFPATNYLGPDRFEFRVSDEFAESEAATFTIQVARQNRAPKSEDQTVIVPGSQNVSFTLNSYDPDDDPVRAVILKGPLHGVLYGSGTNFSYAPKAFALASDSFTYKVWDGQRFGNVARVLVNFSSGEEPRPPSFASIRKVNGVVELTLSLPSSKPFSIQSSTNLLDWPVLLPTTTPRGSSYLFRDTNAPAQMRYYRAVAE